MPIRTFPEGVRRASAVDAVYAHAPDLHAPAWEHARLLSHSGTVDDLDLVIDARFVTQLLAQGQVREETVLLRERALQAYGSRHRPHTQQLNALT